MGCTDTEMGSPHRQPGRGRTCPTALDEVLKFYTGTAGPGPPGPAGKKIFKNVFPLLRTRGEYSIFSRGAFGRRRAAWSHVIMYMVSFSIPLIRTAVNNRSVQPFHLERFMTG